MMDEIYTLKQKVDDHARAEKDMKAEYETKLNNQRKEMLANSDMSKDEQQMMDEIYTLKQKVDDHARAEKDMKAEYETKLNNQRKEMLANNDMSKVDLKYANRIKQIQARHKMEIQNSLEKQRNELLDNIADSDKADLLKRIETLKLEVQKYQQRLDDNDFNGYNDPHYKNTLSDKNDVAPDVVEDFKLRTSEYSKSTVNP